MRTPEEAAENIIKTEGLIFALAVAGKNEGDMREARGFLKDAIVRAIRTAKTAANENVTFESKPSE